MKTAMAMSKEMQFAIDRFKALNKQVKQEKQVNGEVRPELLRERNNALAEAIALVKEVEEHLSGEWKQRLHALHTKLEQFQKEVGVEGYL